MMESEDSIGQMSPNNPFLNNFSVDLVEDDDNETIIDSDYNEDNQPFIELNHIQKVCTQTSDDSSSDQNNDKMDDSESDTEVITNCFNDDLLMGSQLMADKYRKIKQNSNEYDVHKKCKTDQQKERQIRSELQMELELERQQRIHFQKQLEQHMSYSLRKEFEDSKQIKTLKFELLRCKQELQTLKKSLKNNFNNNYNDFDINSNDSNNKSNEEEVKCRDCNSVMKSEVSMILHLINHCIEEEEFRLETQMFRLDEFTDSMIDSIRKSVSYCCPRCHLNFNCLEIYYHIYKCHTKEKPLVCNKCKVYSTHLDYWREHNQHFHNGVIQTLCYIDIGKYVRKTDRVTTNKSYSNGNNSTNHKSYKPYTTNRSNINSNYGLRSVRSRQLRASSSYDSKSVSDRSESPEVIQLCDSPPPPLPPPPVQYRPIIQTKTTLAVKSIPNEYECDFPDCDFKTTSKDKLEFHTSAHTNSKFKCPYCPYVGNILNDIIRHIQKSKKHDGLKVYECRECSFGTNCLSSFKEHLNSRHFSDSDDEDISEFITDMFRNEHSTNDDINGS